MKRSAPLRRTTRLAPVSKRRRERSGVPGKLGIVRLFGSDMTELRLQCFERDGYRCVDCGSAVIFERGYQQSGEMAHVRTKRNNGDTLENVRTKCGKCHFREHNPKAVPPKQQEKKCE